MLKIKKSFILLVFIFCFVKYTKATIVLPSVFSSNMVLQQKTNVAIWGLSDYNETVTIFTSWNNVIIKTKADPKGNWKCNMSTPTAGGPYTITIKDKDAITLTNVLVGEVWFCSGQSNMEMPMKGFKNQPVLSSNEMLLDADNKNLRLFDVKRAASTTPLTVCGGDWKESTIETAKNFSAVAYMYGMMLQKKLKVPVGIIVSSWGGTRIQSWMSKSALQDFPEVEISNRVDTASDKQKYPTTLYNGMIAPFVGYGIKGFIWYQGESNRHEPKIYQRLITSMVKSWRAEWNDNKDSLPFYYVQIAPYGNKDTTRSVRGIREAQMQAMNSIPNCGMASTMDIGEDVFIHPPYKKEVSQRLLYWALAKTYGFKGIAFSGPVYKSMKIDKTKINISFDYAEYGLSFFGKESQNFEIAGEDKQFYTATVKIKEDGTIDVWSEKIPLPVAVRYAYKDFVKGDLYNTFGLPASSFRTDNW